MRKSRPELLAPFLALTLGCGGLVAQPRSNADETSRLKHQIVELRREVVVGEVEIARLRQEITALEEELAAARRTDRRAPSGSPEPILEPEETRISEIPPVVEEEELEDTALPAPELEREIPPAPPTASTETAATSAPPEALSLYDEGYTLFHQKLYRDAEERFQRYLELYPRTELADNAQFWIGECRYARGDLTAALEAFSTTVERYPQGNKVADAMLKAGKCLEALGEREQAEATYREVEARFPGTAAAAVARERLEGSR